MFTADNLEKDLLYALLDSLDLVVVQKSFQIRWSHLIRPLLYSIRAGEAAVHCWLEFYALHLGPVLGFNT